jgi:DNA-directed RNA polymerase specialized sigma24 family protein
MDNLAEGIVILEEVWREVQMISRQKLSERQRVAFWSRHWLQLNGEEIADVMTVMYDEDITRDKVFQYTKEARQKFKQGLKKAGFGVEDLEKVFRQ